MKYREHLTNQGLRYTALMRDSFAQSIHGRSVQLDKAAVLNYCQIKNRQGLWVGCECVFTIVHDVLVASTSVYRKGPGSQSKSHMIEWVPIDR